MNAKAAFSYATHTKFPTWFEGSTLRVDAASQRPGRASRWISRLQRGGVAIAALSLSACQVFQPYVIPEHYGSTGGPKNHGCSASPDSKPPAPNWTDEVDYARAVQRQLSCFARHHAEFASAEGYVFIPLAALIAYQGFKGANPHNIAALSTAGFAAYGIANYQYKPRDVIYLSGVAAIGCAIQLTSPSILSRTQEENLESAYNTFLANRVQVGESISNATANLASAESHLMEARQERAQIPAVAATRPVRDAVDTAIDAVVTRTNSVRSVVTTTRDAAANLPKRYEAAVSTSDQARKDLASATESIVHAVNQQISTMIPDPASLASMLSAFKLPSAAEPAATTTESTGVGDSDEKIEKAVQFTHRGPDKGPLLPADAVDHGTRALRALQAAQTDLAKAEDNLSVARTFAGSIDGYLEPINTPNKLEQVYKECSIDVKAKVPLTIAVPKEGVTVQNGGQAVELPITGGSGKYNPVVTNPQAKGTLSIAVKQGTGNSSVLSISAKDFEKDADMSVLVQDDAGSATSLTVKVKH